MLYEVKKKKKDTERPFTGLPKIGVVILISIDTVPSRKL